MEKNKRICLICNKSLVKIGTARINGKLTHGDWKNRKYHKKCMNNHDINIIHS
jgi:hypothetical protein